MTTAATTEATVAERIGPWIQTYSNRQFWPLDPRVEEIDETDIAWHLARKCRFGGACKRFYSVAEHSLLVAEQLPHHLQLWGLLHDAAEAYLGDILAPLKPLVWFGENYDDGRLFEEHEQRLLQCIAAKWHLRYPVPAEVLSADLVLRATEKRDLMGPEPAPWAALPEPLQCSPFTSGYQPDVAASEWLRKFGLLTWHA